MIPLDDNVIAAVSIEVQNLTEDHAHFLDVTTKLLTTLSHCCNLTELDMQWDDEVILGFLMGVLTVQRQQEKNNTIVVHQE